MTVGKRVIYRPKAGYFPLCPFINTSTIFRTPFLKGSIKGGDGAIYRLPVAWLFPTSFFSAHELVFLSASLHLSHFSSAFALRSRMVAPTNFSAASTLFRSSASPASPAVAEQAEEDLIRVVQLIVNEMTADNVVDGDFDLYRRAARNVAGNSAMRLVMPMRRSITSSANERASSRFISKSAESQ